MKNITFRIPSRVEMGFGESQKIATLLADLDIDRVLVVIDNNLLKLGLADQILEELKKAGIDFTVYDQIKGEPTMPEIDAAFSELDVNNRFSGVIGIGGGSALDTAKLMAAAAQVEKSVKELVGKTIVEPGLPTVIIPTTAGTGSEATPNAIVKDVEQELKVGIVGPGLVPTAVILDPELTVTMPATITAETGIDAFTHAIECYICNKSNPLSDLYALEGIRLLTKYLPQAVKNGENKEARYKTMLASFYGGVAITNSGTGAVHALAYPLGGKYGVSHGLSNAILLAEVMEFNAPAVENKFIKIAEKMGLKTNSFSDKEIATNVVRAIEELTDEVGINVDNIEIGADEIDDLANSALKVERLLSNNPRSVTYEDAKKIYQKVFLD